MTVANVMARVAEWKAHAVRAGATPRYLCCRPELAEQLPAIVLGMRVLPDASLKDEMVYLLPTPPVTWRDEEESL